MLDYRLHLCDTRGDIRHVLELKSKDHWRAIVMADRLSSGYEMELWHDDRLLKRYRPHHRGPFPHILMQDRAEA